MAGQHPAKAGYFKAPKWLPVLSRRGAWALLQFLSHPPYQPHHFSLLIKSPCASLHPGTSEDRGREAVSWRRTQARPSCCYQWYAEGFSGRQALQQDYMQWMRRTHTMAEPHDPRHVKHIDQVHRKAQHFVVYVLDMGVDTIVCWLLRWKRTRAWLGTQESGGSLPGFPYMTCKTWAGLLNLFTQFLHPRDVIKRSFTTRLNIMTSQRHCHFRSSFALPR